MKFEIRIHEKCIYWQEGTVIVEADSEETARELAESGKYEHNGDNDIMFDTEEVLEREVQEAIIIDEDLNLFWGFPYNIVEQNK
jgi:hypothetical protein